MNAYYIVTKELERLLLEDEDVNTVTMVPDMDTNKKDIFPLCHVEVIDAGLGKATIDFGVRIMAMDIRNTNKKPSTDKFSGNDNEDDNLNTMLYVLQRLQRQLTRSETLQIVSMERPQKGVEVRNNVLDGWIWDLRIEVIDDTSGC